MTMARLLAGGVLAGLAGLVQIRLYELDRQFSWEGRPVLVDGTIPAVFVLLHVVASIGCAFGRGHAWMRGALVAAVIGAWAFQVMVFIGGMPHIVGTEPTIGIPGAAVVGVAALLFTLAVWYAGVIQPARRSE